MQPYFKKNSLRSNTVINWRFVGGHLAVFNILLICFKVGSTWLASEMAFLMGKADPSIMREKDSYHSKYFMIFYFCLLFDSICANKLNHYKNIHQK